MATQSSLLIAPTANKNCSKSIQIKSVLNNKINVRALMGHLEAAETIQANVLPLQIAVSVDQERGQIAIRIILNTSLSNNLQELCGRVSIRNLLQRSH
jgi:hypothetical protein